MTPKSNRRTKEKAQKETNTSTTQKTEDWASRIPLKTEDDEPSCSGMVRSFCFTSDSSYMFCKITETAIADCFLHTVISWYTLQLY
jgi:hypothetical protein